MKKFDKDTIFPKKKSLGKRDWGEEILIALISKKISLKYLFLKKGKKGGLQYHHKKDECGFIISGSLLVRYDNGNGKLSKRTLKQGDSFYFPQGLVHQEEAITNVKIIEASTPYFNDRVRVEKKYGFSKLEGLPSTKKYEVKIK